MKVKEHDGFVCVNPECGVQIVVVEEASMPGKPRCACGSEMKRVYCAPVLRVLNQIERSEVEGLLSPHQHSVSAR
jgi:hypothetical protein